MSAPVKINFELLSQLFQEYIREKAKQSGSTIVYKKGNNLIEEDPRTTHQKILKSYFYSPK